MKSSKLWLASCLLLVALCSCAAPVLVPVHNEVRFTGDYVDVRQCDAPPRAIEQFPPSFPVSLRHVGNLSGQAIVRFIIETDGRTSEVQVEEATSAEFAAAASEAVRRWRFAGPLMQGRPVRAACKMPIHFRINR